MTPKQPSSWSGAPWNTVACPLFFLILGGFLLMSPAHFLTTQDEELNLRTTLSLLEGQRGAIPPLPGGFASKRGIDGNEYAQYGLGVPVLYAPWCLVGTLIDPSADASQNHLENINVIHWAGTPFLRAWMTFFTMILTALTIVLVERILRHCGLANAQSVIFALILAFGTYMLPHGRTLFTEPLTALCLVAALHCFIQGRIQGQNKWILLAGCCWGYAILTRLDTLAAMPAAAWLLLASKNDGEFSMNMDLKRIAMFSAPIIAALSIIVLYNQFRFDSLLSTGYEDQAENVKFATPLLVGLHGFLFTPGRSLFLYSPMLIFFPWGFMKLWRRDAWLAGGIAGVCFFYLCVMSKWQNWAGGWDWGPRHIYQTTPFMFILAGAFFLDNDLWNKRAKRAAWALFIALSFMIQFLGLSADPVATIHDMLARFTQAFPDAQKMLAQQYAMQYMVYLPQFSSPVLHWQELWRSGPDLLLLRLAALSTTGFLIYLSLSIAMLAGGIISIRKTLRSNHKALRANRD